MTNEFGVSRRTVLAGLGMIGIASAGAGLGTTAYFRDEESVAAELQAGRLDVKMDYRATYDAGLSLNNTAAIVGGPVLADPDVENGVIVGQAPDIRAADGSAITGQEWAAFTRAADACDVVDEATLAGEIARVGDQLEAEYDYDVDGDEGYVGPAGQIYADGETGLMFDLNDVKPKDAGEATLSLHTCGNPAFLWLRAAVEENDEGEAGIVEPEASLGDVDALGELANYLHVRLWDDVDCDNRLAEGPLDVIVVFDRSCSMEYADPFGSCSSSSNTFVPGKLQAAKDGAKALADELDADDTVGLVSYSNGATLDAGLASVGGGTAGYDAAVDGISVGGGTDIAAGIDAAQAELDANGRPGATPVMVVLSDGFPRDPQDYAGATEADLRINSAEGAIDAARDARDAGTTVYTITYRVSGFPIPELVDLMGTGETDLSGETLTFDYDTAPGDGLATTTSTALVADIDVVDGSVTNEAEIVEAFEAVASFAVERVLYEGSLAGLADLAGAGVPLRTASAVAGEQPAGDEPQCFAPGVYCYAFDWYFVCEPADFERPSDVDGAATIGEELDAAGLPRDPNIAQTDDLRFRLDVAATQCRHNDANANPFGVAEQSTAS